MKVSQINVIERIDSVFTIYFTIDAFPDDEFIMIIDDDTQECNLYWGEYYPPHEAKPLLEKNKQVLQQQIYALKKKNHKFRILYINNLPRIV